MLSTLSEKEVLISFKDVWFSPVVTGGGGVPQITAKPGLQDAAKLHGSEHKGIYNVSATIESHMGILVVQPNGVGNK